MTPREASKGYVEAWDVESLSESGKTYVVSKRRDGSFACSCPAWKFHAAPKPLCKHIKALQTNLIVASVASLPQATAIARAVITPRVEMVRVSFDGVFVASITRQEAESFRFGLTGAKKSAEPETSISGEFRIRRKFRLED